MKSISRFLADKRGDMNMVNAGIMLVVLLTVLYVGISIIDNVQDATDISNSVAATGTLTFTDNTADTQTVNISTDRYEFDTDGSITGGNIKVDLNGTGTPNLTATYSAMMFTANVTSNDAVGVGASRSGDVVTLTADATGAAGNSIATTETLHNASFAATTLTGGADTGTFYTTQESLIDTTESSYSMAGIMPIVMIAVAVLGGLLGVLYLFGRRE
jgi:hypothetical protein